MASRAHLEPLGNPIKGDSGLAAQFQGQVYFKEVAFAPTAQLRIRDSLLEQGSAYQMRGLGLRGLP